MTIIIRQPITFSFIGQRSNNEDFVQPVTQDSRLFMVCDGIGGWDKGEEASRLVSEAIVHYFERHPPDTLTEKYLTDAIQQAYLSLAEYLQQNPLLSRMGSTLALLYLNEHGVFIAHVGDSRVYHLRKGCILHQTLDHKYVLELVAEGIITEEQAQTHPRRNSLSRSIGVDANNLTPKIDKPAMTYLTDVQPGDYFFLCTDGVLEQINNEKLSTIFRENNTEESIIEAVLASCKDRTRDNYSGCLVPVNEVIKENELNFALPSKKNRWAWLGFMLCWCITQLGYAQKGTTYAVVVGIADYKIADYRTGDLRFADKDAQRFVAFLQSSTGGSVPAQNINLLTNSNASKKSILNAMRIFEKAKSQDRVFFYFSGHGMKGAFIPHDVSTQNPNSVLTHAEIKSIFKASNATTKFCIADACLSGSMTARQSWNVVESKTLSPSNVVLMLSSRSTQSSVESGIVRGGIFTFYMLHGLRGQADTNHDHIVAIKELYNFVSKGVKSTTPNKQAPLFYGKFSNDLPMSFPK
jgi:serine/threonine protein phosphatase PrpC